MKSEYLIGRSRLLKFNLSHPLNLLTIKIFAKAAKNGGKKEVSLTDTFYSLVGVYHPYVFKYEIL